METLSPTGSEATDMTKDHGPSIKDDKQYEGLRKKGMSKERAAKIANTPDASSKGGRKSGKKSGQMATIFDSPDGWGSILDGYAGAV